MPNSLTRCDAIFFLIIINAFRRPDFSAILMSFIDLSVAIGTIDEAALLDRLHTLLVSCHDVVLKFFMMDRQ